MPNDELAERRLREPHSSRLAAHHPMRQEILTAHAAALEAELAGYPDPETGLFVFTAAYLRDQESCCDRGCRHCPYLT